MSDTPRVQLGWDAPKSRWEQFLDEVEAEWGGTSPYAGIQIEESWREFRSSGDRHELEEIVERILEASPLSRDADEKKEDANPVQRGPPGETTKVWVRVHEDVKEEMSKYATECNVPYHCVLRAVINWYLGGGLIDRVTEKLGRVVDEVESAFGTVSDDETTTKTDRVTSKLAGQLPDVFDADKLHDLIDEETSGTDYYHDTYAPRIIEKKGVKRVESDTGPDVFMPPEQWRARRTGDVIEQLGGDTVEDTAPAFDREDFVKAANRAGFEISEENAETLNEYRERVLDRLGFVWNERLEQFEPGAGDPEHRPDADVTSYSAGDSGIDPFSDLEAGHPAQQEAGADD